MHPKVALCIKRSYASDMWATGIVMLFVRGYIRAEFKTWKLKEDVSNKFKHYWNWIRQVVGYKKALPKGSILRKMLERDPAKRVQAQELTATGYRIAA